MPRLRIGSSIIETIFCGSGGGRRLDETERLCPDARGCDGGIREELATGVGHLACLEIKEWYAARPTSECLSDEAENDQNNATVKKTPSVAPFFHKELRKKPRHRVVARARVIVRLTKVLSPTSFIIMLKFIHAPSALADIHVPPFKCDQQEADNVEQKSHNREPLLAHGGPSLISRFPILIDPSFSAMPRAAIAEAAGALSGRCGHPR